MVKLLKKLISRKNEAASLTASTHFQLLSDSTLTLAQISSSDTYIGCIAQAGLSLVTPGLRSIGQCASRLSGYM